MIPVCKHPLAPNITMHGSSGHDSSAKAAEKRQKSTRDVELVVPDRCSDVGSSDADVLGMGEAVRLDGGESQVGSLAGHGWPGVSQGEAVRLDVAKS